VRFPHCVHLRSQRGSPAAFQRIPPRSHTDRALPHGQRTIHARESASMLSAHPRGTRHVTSRWMNDFGQDSCMVGIRVARMPVAKRGGQPFV